MNSRSLSRKAKAAAKKRAASLATRKFAFEDMINGDPMCKLADLKVVRHYLRFVDDFEKDAVYASTIDVQATTGLSPAAITASRARLRRLGHFIFDGKTDAGIDRFKLSFARQGLILDHVEMTRQALLERDEERKRKQREKRSSRPDPVISPDEVTRPVCDFTGQGDVISPTRDNLLEELLESFSSEEGETQKECTEVAGDAPFPAPQEEADARRLIIKLLEGKRPSPAQVLFLQHKLIAGDLRQSHIDRLEDAA